MINVNFAYNESRESALDALKSAFSLRAWFGKDSAKQVKNILKNLSHNENAEVFLTLSARSALNLLLKSLNLSSDDKIIVQAFTCEAVVLPIINNNLKPIYVDIEESSLSMDYEDLKKKFDKQAKVLILQHSFGMTPVNRNKILNFAKEKNLIVIEDLAHGFQPDVFSENDQSIKLFSFGRSKLFSTVHGGAIAINDKNIADKFADLHSQLKSPSQFFVCKALLYKIMSPLILSTYSFGFGKLLHKALSAMGLLTREISKKEKAGFYDDWLDKKLPNIFSKLLIKDLNNYSKNVAKKTEISKIYFDNFKQKLKQDNLPILRFPLLVNNPEEIIQKMSKQKIFLGNWYRQVVAPVGLPLSKVYYVNGTCSVAEKVCSQIINLPTNVSSKQAKNLAVILEKYLHAN